MERRGGEQPGLEDAWSAGSLAAAAPPEWVGAPSWESVSREDGALGVVGGGWRHGDEGEDSEDAGWWDPEDEIDGLGAEAYAAFMAEVYDALDGRGRDLPARELHGGLVEARSAVGRAALTPEEAVTVLDDALVEAIESVGRLHTQLGAVGFTLAREAAARGLHREVALSLTDWLRVRCPWLSTQEAAQVTDVVRACDSPVTAQIGDAVAGGTVPVHRAALVARTMRRLEGCLDVDQREAYAEIATRAAARRDLPDKDLARVCHQLVEDLLHEARPGERERAAHELRSVTARRVGPGLTRFTVDAPDGVAATINGVLTSALAAPAPVKDDGGEVVEPDVRTPAQRRFDALATTIGRGIGNPGAPPSTARATVLLVVPFDPARGVPSGPATTATGDYVPPRQAVEIACGADVTPVWLSADGAPLALGRDARYATPAQWKALAVRDGGCSFPGCSALPQWCDSHHVDHWARGGQTDVDRMALLCGRHHTHVHQHDLTATISGSTVTWHV